jgi:type II secretory pathway predicted ATPase ExeA
VALGTPRTLGSYVPSQKISCLILRPSTLFQETKLLGHFGKAMYTDYFGFREKPFGVTPDPRFFYTNPCYQEAYASLLYGIHERRGFIVLTGEVGTGKTTLLRRLMAQLGSKVRCVFFSHTTLSFAELLDFLCEELGLPLPAAGRPHKLRALHQGLMDQLARAGTVALLIDEAQHLGADVLEQLRLLSNVETTAEKLLQIVLVGQPELEAKLARPELRQVQQRIAIHCRLERLAAAEVGPFINYRLNVAGYQRPHLFTPEAVQDIAYYSQGFPRLINILCDNALLLAYATSQRRVTSEIIAEAANDLRFELRGGKPLAAGASRPLSSEAGLTARREPAPLGRTEHQQQADRKSRRRARLIAAVLCLGIGGVGLYVGQVNSNLGEGVKEWLGSWYKTRVGTLGREIEPLERRESPLRGDQLSSGDERMTVSTGAGGPASAADLSGLAAPREGRDRHVTSEPTMTGDGDTLSTPARGGHDEVSAIGSVSEGAGRREKPMVVPPGATVAEIAAQAYGAHKALGLDLIKEYNGHIENLNRIRAGQPLWLPPLSYETLVRPQPDGSYRLILASFRTAQQAEQLAQRARLERYDSVVSARPVSHTLVLHRVEIHGLATREAVERAWEIAFTKHWIAVADHSSGKRF